MLTPRAAILVPAFLSLALACEGGGKYSAHCGDGVVDVGEQCDEGIRNSDVLRGSCRSDCTLARCGDGVVDSGEECDDGPKNTDTIANACRTNCRLAYCGDGVVDQGEQCDQGTANSDTVPGACRKTCTLPRCGDGILDPGEQCDEGGANSDTAPGACRTTCSLAGCGDSVVDPGEQCDNGPANGNTASQACRTNCLLASCGDGVTDPGEDCDDWWNDGVPGHCGLACKCSVPPMQTAEALPSPSGGTDQDVLAGLAHGDTHLVFPSTVQFATNPRAVTRELTLVSTTRGETIRWGENSWEDVTATMTTPGGQTLQETWTLGFTHLLGDDGWLTVGAIEPRMRTLLDLASTAQPSFPLPVATGVAEFPISKLDDFCRALSLDSLTDILPLLHPSYAQTVQEANAIPFHSPANGDTFWESVLPLAAMIEGSNAYTPIRVTFFTNMGLRFAQSWILKWVFDAANGQWSVMGFASSLERERLGSITLWWDSNRTFSMYDVNGPYGRNAVARLLAFNDTAGGMSYSKEDQKQRAIVDAFIADAKARANATSMPTDPKQVVETIMNELTSRFAEGSWQYTEHTAYTMARVNQLHQAHCEAYIFSAALMEALGIRARYGSDAVGDSLLEIWTEDGFQTAGLMDGNKTFTWYGTSMAKTLSEPRIVFYFCDPHAYCSKLELLWTELVAPLFNHPGGIPCFAPATFPFDKLSVYQP